MPLCSVCARQNQQCINIRQYRGNAIGDCIPRPRGSSCADLTDRTCALANRGKACKVVRVGNQCSCSCRSVTTSSTTPSTPKTTSSTPSSGVHDDRNFCLSQSQDVFTRGFKFILGCPGNERNEDLAEHDQDCTNYLGFGGLLDGACVAGKGVTKGGSDILLPVIIIGGAIVLITLLK